MRIIAFAGPSVPPSHRWGYPQVEWRPPAEAGDLLDLVPQTPSRICLIDGYFDHRPAVRHKEILLLLSLGWQIFGAASIGALRAAEMHGLGMVGVGAIYRAYVQGRIVGDDEVALVHGPAQWDWRPLSVPLIDVRATLCRAVRARAMDAESARSLIRRARAIHYVDRTWPDLIGSTGLPPRLANQFRAWLEGNRVDQKGLDARACLDAALASDPGSRRAPPEMIKSPFLDALARERGAPLVPRGPGRDPEAS